MLESRRGEIDSLVSFLRVNYDVSTLGGLEQVDKDNGIRVIRTRRVIIDFTTTHEDIRYIFVGLSPFRKVTIYGLAHELGHSLIDQTNMSDSIKELEADYFAKSLAGSVHDALVFATAYYRMAANPLGTLKYLLFPPLYSKELIRIASRSQ